MSNLEAEIVKLREAVEENTSFLKSMTAKASSSKPAGEDKDTADKGNADEKPATRGRGKGTTAKKDKAPTVAEMKTIGEAFLDVKDEDEYAERRKVLSAIADHFEAERFTAIDSANRLVARDLITLATAGDLDIDDIAGAIESLGDGDSDAKSSRRNDDI
ncbi:MAG TPA: hypothetical protein ENH55_12255 [Aurantimonas coralicida]|uniref:Uncharacterized protein n=2 Tax=root TaxID=1 RepID=A0A9C9NJF2_9HYPH|nr:hypothetical protein [Aurantimonas coralicida]HEU02594.1 hypothetical protein [Aurantimonas coralicida]